MFDLEQAIKQWRKALFKNQALEDGAVEELESHLRDEIQQGIGRGLDAKPAFMRAAAEIGGADDLGDEFYKTHTRGRIGAPPGKAGFLYLGLFLNYLKLILRKLRRQKGYSFINIAGLTVGMACCLLILTWVADELSFDRFFADSDRIYRIVSEDLSGEEPWYYAGSPSLLGPTLKAEYPAVEQYVRVQCGWDGWRLHYGDKWFFQERLAAVDPDFFKVFNFPFIQGDPETALIDKHSVVLTQELAQKCFGPEDPLGKIVRIGETDMKVTGVIQDIPRNTHLQFDYAFPADNMTEWRESDLKSWAYLQFATYIKVAEKASRETLLKHLDEVKARFTPEAKGRYHLQPLTDIHLRSSHIDTWMVTYAGQGHITSVVIFTLIAVCILMIACINFMNLSTARSGTRAREVGMRKVAGAGRNDLFQQFMGESVALSFLALGLALLLVEATLPYFSALLGKPLTLKIFGDPLLVLGFVGVALLTGLFAGSYPSLVLSGMKAVTVLKAANPLSSRSGGSVRKVLVVAQFAFTIALISMTAVIYRQLHYVETKDLGFNADHIIKFWTGHSDPDVLRERLLKHPNIENVTISTSPDSTPYGFTGFDWEGRMADQDVKLYPVDVDFDYLDTFGMSMKEGRFLSPSFATDAAASAVINETAARVMGIKSPVGKRLTYRDKSYVIVGVIQDFHVSSLHNRIEPMVFWIPEEAFHVCVRINPLNIPDTLKYMEGVWGDLVRDYPFEYEFLDRSINSFYITERKSAALFRNFTLLAVFIACLGLFGLASFTAEQRTREIGIRKVLGASTSGITLMLSREFTRWVVLANVAAWPLGWWAARRWLDGFAYRIRLGWEIFVLSTALALGVALATVVYQALRAANADPVRSLRYE